MGEADVIDCNLESETDLCNPCDTERFEFLLVVEPAEKSWKLYVNPSLTVRKYKNLYVSYKIEQAQILLYLVSEVFLFSFYPILA
jgi:hypothetical protein